MKLITWGLVAGMVTYLTLTSSPFSSVASTQEPCVMHPLEHQAAELEVVKIVSRMCMEPFLDEGEPCAFEAGVFRPIVLEDIEKSVNHASAHVKQVQKTLVDLHDIMQTELLRKKSSQVANRSMLCEAELDGH